MENKSYQMHAVQAWGSGSAILNLGTMWR